MTTPVRLYQVLPGGRRHYAPQAAMALAREKTRKHLLAQRRVGWLRLVEAVLLLGLVALSVWAAGVGK